MTQEELSLYFRYDEEVGSKLVRIKDVFGGRDYSRIVAKAGDEVGTKTYQGSNGKPSSLKEKFKGKSRMVHHIIWILQYGEIPKGFMVDHIDRNPFNNSITNLRLVRPIQNNQNRSMQTNNTSGFTGVYWSIHRKETVCCAMIIHNCVTYRKYYSSNKYGLLPSFKMACEWRLSKKSELVSEGAHFTKTHGS